MMEMKSSKKKPNRAIMWRRTMDNLSIEQAELRWAARGPCVAGRVLAAHEGIPQQVEYRIDCDEDWQTRRVEISQGFAGACKTLYLEHGQDGQWRANGTIDATLEGCTDVDLGITPSTNTLPIRRLPMSVGAVREIEAAWVRFPELSVRRARQSYECVSAQQYVYRNRDSGFTAPITVDSDGLVREYGGVWTRVAEGPATPNFQSFQDALVSPAPSAELADAADAMGWLIGGWSAEVRDFDLDGQVRNGSGEWWFSWVLEGRAVQDVWIVPSRAQRSDTDGNSKGLHEPNNRYGTTIRWFNRQTGQWRIVWVNPVSGVVNWLAGRRDGDRIVLEGDEDGHRIRWSFNNIRPNSFIWRGEILQKAGSWNLEAEFRLKRIV
jgi:hypothetical protein